MATLLFGDTFTGGSVDLASHVSDSGGHWLRVGYLSDRGYISLNDAGGIAHTDPTGDNFLASYMVQESDYDNALFGISAPFTIEAEVILEASAPGQQNLVTVGTSIYYSGYGPNPGQRLELVYVDGVGVRVSAGTGSAGTYGPLTLGYNTFGTAVGANKLRIEYDGTNYQYFVNDNLAYTEAVGGWTLGGIGICIQGGHSISALRVWDTTDDTPPDPVPPVDPETFYEDDFTRDMGGNRVYDVPLAVSIIGDNTATWLPAPGVMIDTDITLRVAPNLDSSSLLYGEPAAGQGDRFYVPYNQLGRPDTAEWTNAVALVSLTNEGDSVTLGWLDYSDKRRIAAGVKLTVQSGFIVTSTFRYLSGVRYEDVSTTAGEMTDITQFTPGDYWLRIPRDPFNDPSSEFSVDMSARSGGAWLDGLGSLNTDVYVNEPVVELIGDSKLHYIYVGTDEITLDAVAILNDGTFWTKLVNAEEKV